MLALVSSLALKHFELCGPYLFTMVQLGKLQQNTNTNQKYNKTKMNKQKQQNITINVDIVKGGRRRVSIHTAEICRVSKQLGTHTHTYIYIYIYIWTVFVNVTTKSTQHVHARMIAIIVEKCPNSSHMYDHGFIDNTYIYTRCKQSLYIPTIMERCHLHLI